MIIYFDCFSGISGDMILGALLDLGIDPEVFLKELKKIPLEDYEIKIQRKKKGFLEGTDVEIIFDDKKTHRHIKDLLDIVERSKLSKRVKDLSCETFIKIAKAESRVHNEPIEEVHFHEISGIDTIIDVVGSFLALELLNIDKVYSSPLPLGEGFIEISHGIIPVPAPATVELLKGIPVYSNGVRGELVTPTGAAIITTMTKDFGPMPLMRIERVGYGTGKRDFNIPNLLRVFIGEKVKDVKEEKNLVIDVNIDDMNPQIYGYIIEKLFEKGALDVTITPIYMKKGRPGVLLSILIEPWKENDITEILFKETTTIGYRKYYVDKIMMDREIKEVETIWGKVRVKISRYGSFVKISPEYEDCKRIAEERKIPLRQVMEEIEKRTLDINL
jgi:uncharacterized protein (TIGR00299 family) protein